MAQYVLEILDGDRAGDVVPLTERPLRIGRKPSNDLVLADEKTSGVHAEVALEDGRYLLRDLGSTNGTMLDGKRVTELVLTSGDIVTVGRWRVCFRSAEASSSTADLAVRRLDAGRVQRRGGSVLGIAALLLVALGAGGYLWWQGQSEAGDGGQARTRRSEPLRVAGNKLPPGLASCDSEEGFELRAAGLGYLVGGGGHTGRGCLLAQRSEEDNADFAIARLAEPLAVLSNRPLLLKAYAATDGGGEFALRAEFFAANEQMPFRFRSGTPVRSTDGWSEVELALVVPAGCDRMQLELVAVLPTATASVRVDDLAVLEQGSAVALEQRLEESRQTAIGTGAALAVRSTDPEQPATLLGIGPGEVRSELAGLQKAGYAALSDLGVELQLTATERAFAITATGATALEWVFPADAASSLLLRSQTDAAFVPAAPDGEQTAQALLLGARSTRALLSFEQPVRISGQLGGGVFRLLGANHSAVLQLGFVAERQRALGLLQQARDHIGRREPGAALDLLRRLASEFPHDTDALTQATGLRSELLGEQADRIRELQAALAEAAFYDTRGGYQRVMLGSEQLLSSFFEHNLEDGEAFAAIRQQASARLADMAREEKASKRNRLEALATALADGEQRDLAKLVQDYVQKHLGGN